MQMNWWSRGVLGLSLAALGLMAAVAGTPPALAAANNQTSNHIWYAGVGTQSPDSAVQGLVFLPREIWIHIGDSILWTAKSDDIHTVTFLKAGQTQPPFNEKDPQQTQPQGGSNYTGQTYHNSGILSDMQGMPHTYTLRFTITGDFAFTCLVHPGQTGVVHVRAKGTHLPYSQWQYDRMARADAWQLVQEGLALESATNAKGTEHHVYVGAGNGKLSIMRFMRATVHINVGDTVTFTDPDPIEPHTVIFGKEQAQDFLPYGNPKAYDGSAPLGSGYLGAHFPSGKDFRVTFTKAGTYHYICSLHDMMGMVGTVVVGYGWFGPPSWDDSGDSELWQ